MHCYYVATRLCRSEQGCGNVATVIAMQWARYVINCNAKNQWHTEGSYQECSLTELNIVNLGGQLEYGDRRMHASPEQEREQDRCTRASPEQERGWTLWVRDRKTTT